MIVMVSTKTLSARDPDHSARMKPTEITSKRPPPNTSLSVGRTIASTVCGVSAREAELEDRAARTCSTWAGLMLSNDVADRAGQPEQQRRQGQQREERRLRREPGDPVAEAGADGGDDQPPGGVARRRASARAPEAPRHALRLAAMALRYRHGRRHPRKPPTRRPRSSTTTPSPPTSRSSRRSPGTRRPTSSTTSRRSAPGRHGGGPRARHAGQPARAGADAVRPLRQPRRRGAVPPVLALADGARRRPRPAGGAVDLRRPARARAPGRRLLRLVADRAGPRLPDLDDVRRGAGAARRRRDRQGVDAAAGLHVLRLRAAARRARRPARWPAWA